MLGDQGAILDVIRGEHPGGTSQKQLIACGRQLADELATMPPDQIRAILISLLNRVDIKPDRIEIKVRRHSLINLLCGEASDRRTQRGDHSKSGAVLTLTVKACLQRVGREMRMLVENADQQTSADPGLLRIIARAHDIHARMVQSTDLTVHAIASQEHVTPGYISRLLRLPSLAPDIVTAIVNGKNPPQLTAKKLMRMALELPIDWDEQRKLLRFHRH